MDDPGGSTYHLFLIVVLLTLSALFSGAETAFFSLTQVRLRQMQEKGIKKAGLLQRLVDDGQRLLYTLLIGNTVVNIWFTSLVTTLFLDLLGDNYGAKLASMLATIVTTTMLLIFGEVTPKAIATSAPDSFALLVSKPVSYLHWLMRPLVHILDVLSNLRGHGKENGIPTPSVTEDTIKTAISISEEEGALQQENRKMIYGIFASDDIPIGRIMVPRRKIVAVPIDTPLMQAAQVLLDNGLSRLPVYEHDIDHIFGLVYAKDLLPYLREHETTQLQDVVRPILCCSPGRKLNQLLQEMRARRIQMCVVVNQQGRTVGLVTMEDLLEEIVGEIDDEYDHSPLPGKGGIASC